MIVTEGLRKYFGQVHAVDGLDMQVEPGDIYGFIGPNGAGKTTTIKMLATLLRPTAGRMFVDGKDVTQQPDQVRAVIGFMPDFFGVYDDLKVWEYLDFFAAAYRIPRAERPRIIDGVLELTDLAGKKDVFVETLSRGMKQRLCLAKTLVHDPKVLLLDEPASGLDPRARAELKELLKELRSMGKTILISSHILPELADFCNKVGIIEQGRMVVAGDVEEIVQRVSGGRTFIFCLAHRAADAAAMLGARPDVTAAREADGKVVVDFSGQEGEHFVLVNALVQQGYQVLSFETYRADLEDVFLKVTKGVVS